MAAFSLPVQINNDANCFTLGEACYGSIKGAENAVGVTLGTGFGCGLILNKRVFYGATGTAAEIDMCPYLDGNLEDYISGRGVEKMYLDISGQQCTPKQIEEMARNHIEKAIKIWEQFGKHLGIALSYVVNILDPEAIVIGGSLNNAFDLFFPITIETLHKNINPIPGANLKVVKAELGKHAGFIGAACLVLKGCGI